MFDLDHVRAQFPALATPWALFDNAGGSVPARQVVERVTDYMSRIQVQHGASYALSVEAVEAMDAGRNTAARLLNASPDEVVLGPSSTVLAQHLAGALRPLWQPGDEVVVTNLDHETNIGPWRALEESGIVLREWRFRPDTMRLELEDLEPLLGPRTRLVAFTHCSNVVGTLHDAHAFASRARAAGALSCVDGVAFAPHRRVDVRALDVDFYLASLYKVYGPHVSVLYGKRQLLLEAKSRNHFFIGEDEVPYKYEPGSVPHELAAGVAGIGEYLDSLQTRCATPDLDGTFNAVAAHESGLVSPLLAFLAEKPNVRVLGEPGADSAQRVPTVAFVVDGVDSATIPARLDKSQIAVRYGHFYAYRAIRDLGLLDQNGIVRVSMVHYNAPAEVERLIEGLDATL